MPMREPELFPLMQALSVQYVTDILPLSLVFSGFPTSETSAWGSPGCTPETNWDLVLNQSFRTIDNTQVDRGNLFNRQFHTPHELTSAALESSLWQAYGERQRR
jgi:hypothetical protein